MASKKRHLPINGHRISSLPVTRYCPHAADDSVASRAATVSTAFHALAAGAPEAAGLFAGLSEEEQQEVAGWKMPTPLKVAGHELSWADGLSEQQLAVDESFKPVGYDSGEQMTQGTADKLWLIDDELLVIADLKRSTHRISVTSEQLLGYAMCGCAIFHTVKRYVTALWDLIEGTWKVGPIFKVGSLEYAEHKMIVRQAALNLPSRDNGYSIGGHCSSCYHRPRCPAYLMPTKLAEQGMRDFTAAGNFDALDNDERLKWLVTVGRIKETLKVMEGVIKESAKKIPIVDYESGKEWREVSRKGKEGLDRVQLEKDHPGLLSRYIKRGKPSRYCDWRKL